MAESKQEANIKAITNDLNVLLTPQTETDTQLKSLAPSPAFYLREWLVDPASGSSPADLQELHAQRIACGWNADRVPIWAEEIKTGIRQLWFIHLSSESAQQAAGMISLNLHDASDESIANLSAGGDRVEIGSLFVYPAYRRLGLGQGAIREVERRARALGARVVTMNTAAVGENVRRYEGMGYTLWKVEKKYPVEVVRALGLGEEFCFAAFLEKRVE